MLENIDFRIWNMNSQMGNKYVSPKAPILLVHTHLLKYRIEFTLIGWGWTS